MRITAGQIGTIFSHVASSNDEVCGVLIGQCTPHTEVSKIVMGRNVHPQPRRHFLLDAATLLQADAIANENNQTIIGFYHSHPSGTALPSNHDLANAWPHSIMLIVAGGTLLPHYCCAWILDNHRLTPTVVHVIPGH